MNTSRGQKKGLTEKQVKLIKRLLKDEKSLRDYCLFAVQIDSMLRSSDVRTLLVSDVLYTDGSVKEELTLKQQKTKRTITVHLQEDTRKALKQYIAVAKKETDSYLFTAQKSLKNRPITLMAHSQLVNKWTSMIGLDPVEYGTHSLRRTKSAIIYEKTGNVEVVRQLLGAVELCCH